MQAPFRPSASPRAAEVPKTLEMHGHTRLDPYFWLKDRENPEVKEYLEAENAYTEGVLEPVRPLREEVLAELNSRVAPSESSQPFFHRGYYYQSRYEPGKDYPIYGRRRGSMSAPEERLVDVNDLARGHEYTAVHFPDISPDSSKMIYAADFVGRRFYDLHVIDLLSGQPCGEPIRDTTGNSEWANDNRTIFYSKQDPDTLRARWIYRHELGSAGEDQLVYEEEDDTFDVMVGRSRTDSFLYLVSSSTLSTEWRVLEADRPEGVPRIFLPREADHEYAIEDGGDGFYVLTNWGAKNFRIMKAPHRASAKEEWTEVVPHRDEVFLEGISAFATHFVLSERSGGQTQLTVVNRNSGEAESIAFPDPVYLAFVGTNPEYGAEFFRYGYESLHRPLSVFDYHFARRTSELRKVQLVPTYEAELYTSERLWAPARDGVSVPVSLVYRKGFSRGNNAALLLYAYGSYGLSSDPSFNPEMVSLLDRGFVFAVAHVRGGSEMGRAWYEDGKLARKMNTFHDFIDATEFLLREGYGKRGRVYANGASAGGLLMGVVANLRPDLYRGVNAGVPFVDVLTTMLDENIPLTTSEYDEWGDPRDPEQYRVMAAYSPYDNIKAQAYPNMLITAGFHDSQVQYWEPAKWAAKLRRFNTGNSVVLLYTEMGAGHGGASGRYQSLAQTALEYAFYLMLDAEAGAE